jgi:carbonic anhydrase/acetyltransferase-like protein (isoleucine patch superfamily)
MNRPQEPIEWPKLVVAVPEAPAAIYPDEHRDWDALWCHPEIDPTAWVAPGAVVFGRVRLKTHSSVWYGCVLRGDGAYIEVGEETNVQDGSILHIDCGRPCILGNRVTLGHRALVHASVVEDGAMIAIGATVLSRCTIGAGALIAAGALVLEGTQVPPNTLWAGVPAKQIRELTAEQQLRLKFTYRHYVNNGAMALERYGRTHIDALLEQPPAAAGDQRWPERRTSSAG